MEQNKSTGPSTKNASKEK